MADIRINALTTTATSSASDDYIAIDGSANGTRKLSVYSPTFGGNLTVSGTGTSSVAGSLVVNNATALGGGKISVLADLSAANGVVIKDSATSYAGNDNFVLLQNSAGTTVGGLTHPAAGSLGIWGNDDIRFLTTASATEMARINSTGNLLLGTTTDSGNGKLQLATHSDKSGGIGFGTDTSLYRANAGQLYLDAPASTSGAFWVNGGSGNASAAINLYPQGTGTAQIGAVGATSLLLRTNNTTALTLDSSQNATFAGTYAMVSSGNPQFRLNETDQAADGRLWIVQSETGLLKFRAFNDAISSGVDALRLGRTGKVSMPNLPTSSAGLSSGDIWNNSGVLNIVP